MLLAATEEAAALKEAALKEAALYRELLLPDAQDFQQLALHFHIWHPWHICFTSRFGEIAMPIPHGLETWESRLKDLVWAMNSRRLGQAMGEPLIKELLASLIAHGAPFEPPPEHIDDRISQTLNSIHEHFHASVTVSGLANEIGGGRCHRRFDIHAHLAFEIARSADEHDALDGDRSSGRSATARARPRAWAAVILFGTSVKCTARAAAAAAAALCP